MSYLPRYAMYSMQKVLLCGRSFGGDRYRLIVDTLLFLDKGRAGLFKNITNKKGVIKTAKIGSLCLFVMYINIFCL